MGDDYGNPDYGNDANLQAWVAIGIEGARVQLNRLDIPFPAPNVVNQTIELVIAGADNLGYETGRDDQFRPLFIEMSVDQFLVEQAVRGVAGHSPLPNEEIVDGLGDIIRRLTRWLPTANGQTDAE